MKTCGNIIISALLLCSLFPLQGQTDRKKVFIHYMGWFDKGVTGRHWSCGQAYTPLIGYYNSLSWATQMYHILLSWSCGIDGLIINVKDEYDAACMKGMVQTLKRLYAIDHVNFNYDFSISYDDQGLSDIYEAEEKFIYLRDYILTEPIDFLRYNGTPAIYAFNYPDQYLTAEEYVTALDEVFTTGRPILIWNQIETDALGYADSFYPWVEPGGVWNGSNWGQVYLDWFYPELDKYTTQLDFATGGVWAGFDDRPNTCWGDSRWIDRQDGWVYNKTWEYANTYSGELPLLWVVIETWNDWNEGTEIEPGLEYGYKYLQNTIDNINVFKGTALSSDTGKFEALKNIYMSADSIERGLVDSAIYYPPLEDAIATFIRDNPVSCISYSKTHSTIQLDVLPNPATSLIQFTVFLPEASEGMLAMYDLSGRFSETIYSGFLPEGNSAIRWISSGLKKGMYICSFITERERIAKRIELL
jgi:hypothetical protein